MKIKCAYTFDASAKQVTFTGYTTIDLSSVLIVVNTTDNIILYNFADPLKGGTVSGNILTLNYNTTTMDDTDKLMVYYDDIVVEAATEATLEALPTSMNDEVIWLLRRMVKLLEPLSVVDVSQRQRVIASVDSCASHAVTLSSLATVTTLNQIANVDARETLKDIAKTAYGAGIRNGLLFS